ncbi:hypothetical protein FRC12_002898 [Ceratobasidium sp. 428]|nr:hypothetical protein FRC12_002898 [Ceratobasidium sp. 428]
MSSPNHHRHVIPPTPLSSTLTPTALPPPFGIESLHDWSSQTGSIRSGSPPPSLKSHRVHPYQRHNNGVSGNRSFRLECTALIFLSADRAASLTVPQILARPPAQNLIHKIIHRNSWIGSLRAGNDSLTTESESIVPNHGSDDGKSVTSEDEESRPPCRYLDTMALESKGKRKDVDRVTASEKPKERESYEEYTQKRNSGAHHNASRSEHSAGSTNTQALQEMKQSDAHIGEIIKQIEHTNTRTSEEGPWVGPTQGHTWICPRDHGVDVKVNWTFSPHGIGHMDPGSYTVGHIHFAYASSSAAASSSSVKGGVSFTYWVCVRKKTKSGMKANEKYWAVYEPGQSHPIYTAYVLKKRTGIAPPLWVLV